MQAQDIGSWLIELIYSSVAFWCSRSAEPDLVLLCKSLKFSYKNLCPGRLRAGPRNLLADIISSFLVIAICFMWKIIALSNTGEEKGWEREHSQRQSSLVDISLGFPLPKKLGSTYSVHV